MKTIKMEDLLNDSKDSNEVLRLLEMIYGNFNKKSLYDTFSLFRNLKNIILFEAEDYNLSKISFILDNETLYFKSIDMYHYYFLDMNESEMYIINIAELKENNEVLFNEKFLLNKDCLGFLPVMLISQFTKYQKDFINLDKNLIDLENIININYNNISTLSTKRKRKSYEFIVFLSNKEDFINFFDNEDYGFHLVFPPSGVSRNNEKQKYLQEDLIYTKRVIIDGEYSEIDNQPKFLHIDELSDNYSNYYFINKKDIKEYNEDIFENMKRYMENNNSHEIKISVSNKKNLKDYTLYIYYDTNEFNKYMNSKI